MGAISSESKTQIKNLALARPEGIHQKIKSLLAFVIIPKDGAFVVRHGFSELEVTVIIENSVERNRGSSGSLQVGQVLQTAAGSSRQFLRGRQVPTAMSQCFRLLLKQTEFLEVMWRKTDQMGLTSYGDLEGLAYPPGCVGCQTGTVADIETIDGLH